MRPGPLGLKAQTIPFGAVPGAAVHPATALDSAECSIFRIRLLILLSPPRHQWHIPGA